MARYFKLQYTCSCALMYALCMHASVAASPSVELNKGAGVELRARSRHEMQQKHLVVRAHGPSSFLLFPTPPLLSASTLCCLCFSASSPFFCISPPPNGRTPFLFLPTVLFRPLLSSLQAQVVPTPPCPPSGWCCPSTRAQRARRRLATRRPGLRPRPWQRTSWG